MSLLAPGAPRALTGAAGALLRRAVDVYAEHPPVADRLRQHVDRLEQPLRVALTGTVKAGKSTLLNALVGEKLAPVDAGECTRIVTWYRESGRPAVTMVAADGTTTPLAVIRRDGALVVDLRGTPAEDVGVLRVDWPAPGLRTATLIDTPGLNSLSAEVGRRTLRFLHPEDEQPTEADAVVHLMRHLHAGDAAFLEAFRGDPVSPTASVNSLAVISRADEIGGGRVDAMVSARAIARRYRADPALRGVVTDVVTVAGLLAETGRTLRGAECTALAALAGLPRDELEAALLTVDRFVAPGSRVEAAVPSADDRARLLRRFGVFGLRLATTLVRQGVTGTSALAVELVRRSGLDDLRAAVDTRFVQRADVLKARSALLAVHGAINDRAVVDHTVPGSSALVAELERLLTGAHEFVELRLLSELCSGAPVLPAPLAAEGRTLLGESGAAVGTRLGCPDPAGDDDLRAAALDALARWQEHAENPMLDHAAARACRVVVRTCEGMVTGRG